MIVEGGWVPSGPSPNPQQPPPPPATQQYQHQEAQPEPHPTKGPSGYVPAGAAATALVGAAAAAAVAAKHHQHPSGPPPATSTQTPPVVYSQGGYPQGYPAKQPVQAPSQPLAAISSGPTAAEFASLKEQLSQRNSELARLHQENALQERLRGDKANIISQEEVKDLKEKIARLETQCKSSLDQFTSIEKTLEQSETVNYTLGNEKNALEIKLEEMKKLLAVSQDKHRDIDGEVVKHKTRIENLLKESHGMKEELTMTTKAKEDMEKKQVAIQEEIGKMKTNMEEQREVMNKEREVTKTETEAMKKEIEDLKKEVEAEKTKSKELSEKPVDLAPGMDPWYKESLVKFRNALFEEMSAWPVEKKTEIFKAVISEEAKRRNITPGPWAESGASNAVWNAAAGAAGAAAVAVGASGIAAKLDPVKATKPEVMTPGAEDEAYSPGGRPIMRGSISSGSQPSKTQTPPPVILGKGLPPDVEPRPRKESLPKQSLVPKVPEKPFVTPIVTEQKRRDSSPGGKGFIPYRKESNTPVTPSVDQVAALTAQTNAPVYKGFKYEPASNKLQKVSSIAEMQNSTAASSGTAILPSLQRNAVSVGAVPLAQANASNIAHAAKNKRMSMIKPMETFIPGIDPSIKETPEPAVQPDLVPHPLKPKNPTVPQEEPKVISTPTPAVPPPSQEPLPTNPLERLKFLLPPLLRMPNPANTHPLLAPIYADISKFSSNDFSFIDNLTTAYEANLKKVRQKQESEREARVQQAQEDPNRLFNSGKIKYSDIGDLEAELKKIEDELRDKEDDAVWKMYLDELFTPAYARIDEELRQLVEIDARLEALLQRAVAGGKGLSANCDGNKEDVVAVLDVLHLLLRANELLDKRSIASHNVITERDRQYKRHVVRTLYRRGDSQEMRRVERGLGQEAMKQDVMHKQDRLNGVSSLWKRLKIAVYDRGLAENNSFANAVISAASAAAQDTTSDRIVLTSSLQDAKSVLEDLSANSVGLLGVFAAVDAQLNDGEFDFMLAQERLSGAPKEVFDDLAKQKRIQDGKLKIETKEREDKKRREGEAWVAEVGKVLNQVGGGSAGDAGKAPVSEDERMREEARRRTLIEARRRNGEMI
jgi:hypothetical protein